MDLSIDSTQRTEPIPPDTLAVPTDNTRLAIEQLEQWVTDDFKQLEVVTKARVQLLGSEAGALIRTSKSMWENCPRFKSGCFQCQK